ncbi:hypothetical protein GCM10010377_22810 [Streptomyces viridiviolaceus]|nr:hypothetical protein GCM10010377_22810 [Streptomyces viridiviolaceus]
MPERQDDDPDRNPTGTGATVQDETDLLDQTSASDDTSSLTEGKKAAKELVVAVPASESGVGRAPRSEDAERVSE